MAIVAVLGLYGVAAWFAYKIYQTMGASHAWFATLVATSISPMFFWVLVLLGGLGIFTGALLNSLAIFAIFLSPVSTLLAYRLLWQTSRKMLKSRSPQYPQ